MRLTDSQRHALTILLDFEQIAPTKFARKMWPDSPGWKRSHKCGPSGASKGAMMSMAGGGYLGKLSKKGWVKMVSLGHGRGHAYAITKEGKRVVSTSTTREEECEGMCFL